jgi:hypothetical protein
MLFEQLLRGRRGRRGRRGKVFSKQSDAELEGRG